MFRHLLSPAVLFSSDNGGVFWHHVDEISTQELIVLGRMTMTYTISCTVSVYTDKRKP